MLATRTRHRPSLLRRAGGDAGFTLIEVLVASALSVVVFGSILSVLVTSQTTQARDQEWALVLEEARSTLSQMVTELRQTYEITSDSSNAIEFYATIGEKHYRILYNCAEKEASSEYNMCVRKAIQFTKEGATLTPPTSAEMAAAKAEPVIHEVLNGTSADSSDSVFVKYSPTGIAPDLITIKVEVPASGTLKLADAGAYKQHIVLENAAYLRNAAVGT